MTLSGVVEAIQFQRLSLPLMHLCNAKVILEKLDNASVKDLQPTEAMSTEKKWINQLDVTSTKKAILYLI